MCFLFSGIFWGLVLVALGVAVIIKVLFHIDIPVFRIVFAMVLIYFGLKLLVGGCGRGYSHTSQESVVFNEGTLSAEESRDEYSVVFGKGTIDLTGLKAKDKNTNIRVSTVFGASTLKLDPAVPAVVNVSAAFGSAHIPDGTTTSFGHYTYKTKAYKEGKPYLAVMANVVFGEMTIVAP